MRAQLENRAPLKGRRPALCAVIGIFWVMTVFWAPAAHAQVGDVGGAAGGAVDSATGAADSASGSANDATGGAVGEATDAAGDTAGSTGGTVDNTTDTVNETVNDVADGASGATNGATDPVTDPVTDAVGGTTDAVDGTVGETTGGIGSVLTDPTDVVDDPGGTLGDVLPIGDGTADAGPIGTDTSHTTQSGGIDTPGAGLPGTAASTGSSKGRDRFGDDRQDAIQNGAGSTAGMAPDALTDPALHLNLTTDGAAAALDESSARDAARTSLKAADINAIDAFARVAGQSVASAAAIGALTESAASGGSTAGPLMAILQKAAEATRQLAFPLALTMMVVAFLSIQSRVDRNDAKLSLAPVDSDQEVLYFE